MKFTQRGLSIYDKFSQQHYNYYQYINQKQPRHPYTTAQDK